MWGALCGAVAKKRGKSCVLVVIAAVALMAAGAAADTRTCSRARSDEAVQAIEDVLLPEATRLGVEVPARCPLSAARDMFAKHRASAVKVRSRHWRCGMCEKLFKTRDYLDAHFDRAHADEVPDDPVCLGDMCDILPCAAELALRRARGWRCDPGEMERRRTLCNAVVHRCFDPTHGGRELEMHDAMTDAMCSRLHCDEDDTRPPPPPLPGKGTPRWRFVAACVVVVLVLVFYIVLYATRSERRHRDDLSNRTAARRMERLKFWGAAKKSKLY